MLSSPVRLAWTIVTLCLLALFAAPAHACTTGPTFLGVADADAEHQPDQPALPVEAPAEEDDAGGEDDLTLPACTEPHTPHGRPVRHARRATPPPPAPAEGTLFRPPERA